MRIIASLLNRLITGGSAADQSARERAIAYLNYLNGVRDVVRSVVAMDAATWQEWLDQHDGDERQAMLAVLARIEDQAHEMVLADLGAHAPTGTREEAANG